MIVQGTNYNVLGVFGNSITLPDSFSVQSNKYGKGHGEAKLYVAPKPQMNDFFQDNTDCFVLKDDFIKYRDSLSSAQTVLASIYKNAISENKNFRTILKSIDLAIENMQAKEDFNIKLMNGLKGPRGYINTTNDANTIGYYLLRACCIPFVSFIRILKLEDSSTGKIYFYFKLFPNFDEMYNQIQYIQKYGKQRKTEYRSGQSKYKKELVELFTECPFTHIQDERLLVASHILPFASCMKNQRYDTANGLLLSPLYDTLFDKGFITFDQNGNLKKTVWLSPSEWNNIPLDYSVADLHLTPERKAYLSFHEKHVFLGD